MRTRLLLFQGALLMVSVQVYHHTGFSPFSLRHVMGSLTCKWYVSPLHGTSIVRPIRGTECFNCTSLHLETEGEARSHTTLASMLRLDRSRTTDPACSLDRRALSIERHMARCNRGVNISTKPVSTRSWAKHTLFSSNQSERLLLDFDYMLSLSQCVVIS